MRPGQFMLTWIQVSEYDSEICLIDLSNFQNLSLTCRLSRTSSDM
jgi:hypothetical protein